MKAKQLTRFSIIIAAYLILSVIFNSCICGDHYSRLKGIQHFYSFQPDLPTNPYSDTITTTFSFYTAFNIEYLTQYSFQLLTNAYAFQPCPREIVNPIDPNSIKIILDQDLIFDGDTLQQGTSILDLEGAITENYIDYDDGLAFNFDSLFISKANFEKDWYIFILTMTNFDTIPETFTASDTLFMNLD